MNMMFKSLKYKWWDVESVWLDSFWKSKEDQWEHAERPTMWVVPDHIKVLTPSKTD